MVVYLKFSQKLAKSVFTDGGNFRSIKREQKIIFAVFIYVFGHVDQALTSFEQDLQNYVTGLRVGLKLQG